MRSALKILLWTITYILSWTLLIFFLTAQLSYDGSDWATNFALSFQQSLPWIFTSPIIIIFALWLPIVHDRWWINSLIHLTLCIIILIVVGKIRKPIGELFPPLKQKETTITTLTSTKTSKTSKKPTPPNTETDKSTPAVSEDGDSHDQIENTITRVEIIHNVGESAPLGVPLYISIVLLISLLQYRQDVHQRDEDALRLESRLTQTQLDLLRSQLQPHFLFNTLNSISCLIHSAPDKADSMIIQLSDLLRSTLEQRNEAFIPIEQEITTLLNYLQIQSSRFGDRILIKTSIAPETSKLQIPPMILLPLVENAVRYGVEKSTEQTTIHISSKISYNKLILSVTDNGPGIKTSEKGGTGVGLQNTTNRLQSLYPKDSTSVTLKENSEGLTEATIELPLS